MQVDSPLQKGKEQRQGQQQPEQGLPDSGNSKSESESSLVPKPETCWEAALESNKLIFILFFWLGITTLLPYVSFITSAGYFQNRFCGSSVENSFLIYFIVAYNLSNAATQALLLRYYQSLVPFLRLRVLGSLALMLAICLLTTVCVLLPDLPAMTLFSLTLISLTICGSLAACYTGGLFSVLGTYPMTFTQAFVSGQGLAGCGVSIVSFVTIALGGQDEHFCSDEEEGAEEECWHDVDYSALAFFITCCVVVVVAIGCYCLLEKLPSTVRYRDEAIRDRVNSVAYGADMAKPLLHASLLADHNEEFNEGEGDYFPPALVPTIVQSKYLRIYQQIKVPAWSVFCTFSITLSLFPAITVLITSENKCDEDEGEGGGNRFYNDLFIPLFFFIFGVCDFLGRMSARHVKAWVTPSNMLLPTVLRTAFYPLILLCNVEGTVLPVAFKQDVLAMLIVSGLGLSNGLLVSLAMMTGPGLVAPRHKSMAATIMLLALTMGLCCGSLLSFVTVYISQGSF